MADDLKARFAYYLRAELGGAHFSLRFLKLFAISWDCEHNGLEGS
jgi:hypothetical protein